MHDSLTRFSNCRTRDELASATVALIEPLVPYFTPEGSGILPGCFGAAYSHQGAFLEGFARPLWGLAPLFAGGGNFEHVRRWQDAIAIGCDPDQPGYWGTPGDLDQRYVECASLSTAILLAPNIFWKPLSDTTKRRLLDWIGYINQHEIAPNNWRFFRVLTNLAIRSVGATADAKRLSEDLDLIDSCYLGDGWYSDGKTDQRDHYIAFAFQYYGLMYSVYALDTDRDRCQIYRDRAVLFAKQYESWFDSDGASLPYGRSLSYRFGHAGFWAALAFAGVEALPWSQIKGLFFRNMRYWFSLPILNGDGVLSVGYAYPNLLMSEQYNGPGSPYWGLKCMLPLALRPEHPFWQAEEATLAQDDATSVQEHPHLLIRRGANGHVIALSAGQYISWGLRYRDQKYSKFAYSTRRSFCVDVGDDIAFDSALALSDDGRHWRFRHSVIDWTVDGEKVVTRSRYFDDVEVTTTLRFAANGEHTREHRIRSARKLWSAEGGFPLDITSANMRAREIEEKTAPDSGRRAALTFGGVTSWIEDESPDIVRERSYAHELPNQNLLFPRCMIPLLRSTHQPGEFVLKCRVGE